MRILRRVLSISGVVLGALLFSYPALARHHAEPQKAVASKHAKAENSRHAAAKGKETKTRAGGKEARGKSGKWLETTSKGKRSRQAAARGSRKQARMAEPVKVSMRRERVEPREADTSDFDSSGNPLLRSSAFYVQDVRTGQVLLEKNSNSVVPIASITKLMTAMVVLDARLPLNEMLEVSEDDVDKLKGTSSRLVVGTRLTREEFMRLALMSSENRAALALSRYYPGGRKAFMEAMNAKAQLLGMSDTRYYDPSGLNQSNVSSARDLAILVSNASHYPLIREFTTTAEYTVDLASGRPHTFHNTNALVKSPEWQIEVSKTGFINESGKCLVMQAWMANKPLAIVLLDSWGRFTRLADANRIRRWLEEALPRGGSAKVADTSGAHRPSL
ncbi:D-alanyl-D-alanine endopeptidase [Uliginosibacterium gangwonense]|uniref:D-alanyl-D-alanine endopeptidase n=1 Tax=Uliginosibacterium gangwonense TaxID=392736 RepID=UPI00036F9932|nr:D-alanyl-D-alanine endopeptidase [Uliginosibacterium gangwonense]